MISEELGKTVMRRVRLRGHQKPGSIPVEPMHDSGPFHSSDSGEACAAMGEERIDERPRFMSGGRMHHEPGRLVDDEQILVLEDDFEWNLFAQRRGIGGRGKAQPGGLARAEQQTRVFHRSAVDGSMASFDQPLHSRARQIRRRRRKETVEPVAAVIGRNPIGKEKIAFLTQC